MSSIWSSVLSLDLTIPSNGSTTAGSGTIYIGGPRLPSELVAANFKGALVFYSDAIGLAAGVKYWYLARFTDGIRESLSIGWCDLSGVLTDMISGGYDSSIALFTTLITSGPATVSTQGNDIYAVTSTGDVTVASLIGALNLQGTGTDIDAIANNLIRLRTISNGITFEGPIINGPVLKVSGLTASPSNVKMKVTTNGNGVNDQDVWNSSTTLQTVNGIANFQCNIYWRWTADYICEVRFYLLSSGPVPAGGTLTCNMPANFPSVDYAPGNPRGPAGVAIGSGGANLTTMASRIQAGTPNTLQVFMAGNPNNNLGFEGSFVFTLAK